MSPEMASCPVNNASAERKICARPLDIWWVSQYASTPDQQFTTQYDLARKLADKGHRVTFFAAGFSHYKFKEIRLKDGENWREELHNGVRFVWIRTPAYRANNWKRVYNMCTFSWRAYWIARRRQEVPDLIIGTTFHPLASLCAYCIAVSKRKPFLFEVKDLWPLTMIEFGKLSSKSPLAVVLRLLERFLAHRSCKIMTTLPGVADYYAKLGVPKEKTVWIPNGLELSRYASLKPYDGHLPSPFVLLYAGGHVSANALATIIRAAQIEQETVDDVQFVFVGDGQEKTQLVKSAKQLNLRNIQFRDAVPKSELHKTMEEADAFILSMRNLPRLYQFGMSFNKLCDYVASGRPVLFAGNSSYNVVKEFNCGIVVPPEDPEAFVEAINEFRNLTDEQRAEMGRNGVRCAKERFDISMLADRLEKVLLSVVADFRGLPVRLLDPELSGTEKRTATSNEAAQCEP